MFLQLSVGIGCMPKQNVPAHKTHVRSWMHQKNLSPKKQIHEFETKENTFGELNRI